MKKNKTEIKQERESAKAGFLEFFDNHSRTWTFALANISAFMMDDISNDLAEVRVFPKQGNVISFLGDKADALVQIDRWKEYCQQD